jgi:hypothetical protein
VQILEGDLMGSSKSTSKQSTADKRVVADGGSVGISGDGNTVNVTDGGLIEKGLKFLEGAETANTDRLALMLSAGGQVLQASQATTSAAMQGMETLLNAKKDADTPASQQSALYLALIAAGVIVLSKVVK